jgi:hypothetical protein
LGGWVVLWGGCGFWGVFCLVFLGERWMAGDARRLITSMQIPQTPLHGSLQGPRLFARTGTDFYLSPVMGVMSGMAIWLRSLALLKLIQNAALSRPPTP